MKRLAGIYPLVAGLPLLGVLFLAGCVTLPRTIAVPQAEQLPVRRQFAAVLDRQQQCGCCIDARAVVTLKSIFRTGTIDGYLQAKTPSFLKFVGLNPLGQPLLLFATDGSTFRYISVPDAKSFEGSTAAAAFVKYAPKGFHSQESFSWLTGRLPAATEVSEVARDENGAGYWLTIQPAEKETRRQVLFDPGAGVILRQMLVDRSGELLVDVRYRDYVAIAGQGRKGPCQVPGKILVSSEKQNSASMTVSLSDWLIAPALTARDFTVSAPAGFKRVKVE